MSLLMMMMMFMMMLMMLIVVGKSTNIFDSGSSNICTKLVN